MPNNHESKTLNPKQNLIKPNIKIQDSLFSHLFREPEYTAKLYEALYPEKGKINKEQIEYVTLENVLVNQGYNDLGFIVIVKKRHLVNKSESS